MHTWRPTRPYDVKVDRSSALGNPFNMRNEADRHKVCNEYTKLFAGIVNNEADCIEMTRFTDELERLKKLHVEYGKLRLFCWCAPKRCHAETIKQFLEGV